MKVQKITHKLRGAEGRYMPVDVFFTDALEAKPIIIFAHGFKGYKDWGAWPLLANYFAEKGFLFVSFNFSHNGGTLENPIDFPDLEAFSNNTYSYECFDLEAMIDFVSEPSFYPSITDKKSIYLMGHSRGGGMAILTASRRKEIKKLITLAAIGDIESRFPKEELLHQWQKEGLVYIPNSRTNQQMPMRYSIYEDYIQNKESLNIGLAAQKIAIPFLIIHAKDDPSVPVEDAYKLHEKQPKAELFLPENGGHTFGMTQPWEVESLPPSMEEMAEKMLAFLKH